MKSHVSMEQHQCFVCGELFDTGAILLDKRLRASMEAHTVTATGVCPEHQAQIDAGFVLLIGVSDAAGQHRTGDIIAIKEQAFTHIFNCNVPPKKIAFVEPAAVAHLKRVIKDAQQAAS